MRNKIHAQIRNLRYDIPSSLVVFLVALPLCLGVALASGAPLMSGLLAGVIGGIVVGIFSGSHSSVSGPAAGLTAIVASSIEMLTSDNQSPTEAFSLFLVAIVLAGILQVVFGLFKAGVIANYFPSSVIKGLLAAIGIILIIKQFPLLLGINSVTPISTDNIMQVILPGAIVLSLISILILLFWDSSRLKKLPIPAALVAVIVAVLLNISFQWIAPSLMLGKESLVSLPVFTSLKDALGIFSFPDWSALGRVSIYIIAVKIAIVASLETLLNLQAVDKIDPQKRHSSPNQELVAQGLGNITAGLIGGIPVTSVIVRSSVNLNAGAKSRTSTILHGVLLLLCSVFIATYLNLIPYAVLAAILVLTGYKLANVGLFKEMYHKGVHQFIPFITTIVVILFTDLLVGILVGLITSFVFILRNNKSNGFTHNIEKLPTGNRLRIIFSSQVSFLNKERLTHVLHDASKEIHITIDASQATFIDQDVLDSIREFHQEQTVSNPGSLSLIGFKKHHQMPESSHFQEVITKEIQSDLTPMDVLEKLRAGNLRFIEGKSINKDLLRQAQQTHQSQYPMAVMLGCIDSRSSSETVFDLGLGDIFSTRIAGNVASAEVIGSMEYATRVAGAKLIVVKGHTNCGAIRAACDGVHTGNIHQIIDKIQPAIEREEETTFNRTSTNERYVENVTRIHICNTMKQIREQSPIIDAMLREGKIGMAGAIHDLRTGRVKFIAFNEEWNQIRPVYQNAS